MNHRIALFSFTVLLLIATAFNNTRPVSSEADHGTGNPRSGVEAQSAASSTSIAPTPVALPDFASTVSSVAWSPAGNRIALGGTSGVTLFSSNVGSVPQLSNATDVVNSLAWSPDGSYLAAATASQSASIWNVSTGSRVALLERHTAGLTSIAWSPDDRL